MRGTLTEFRASENSACPVFWGLRCLRSKRRPEPVWCTTREQTKIGELHVAADLGNQPHVTPATRCLAAKRTCTSSLAHDVQGGAADSAAQLDVSAAASAVGVRRDCIVHAARCPDNMPLR